FSSRRRHTRCLSDWSSDVCSSDLATDVERVTLSRDAVLWAWTAVTAAPPGYEGAVPYGFGVVELVREHLRVVTRLREADPAQLRSEERRVGKEGRSVRGGR